MSDTIKDLEKREIVVCSIIGITQKYLTLEEYEILEGEFKVTTVLERYEEEIIQKAEKRGVQKGIKQGIDQGIVQGIEQSIDQGIVQGIEQSNLKCVARLFAEGFDIDFIVSLTELPKDRIKQLQSQIKIH